MKKALLVSTFFSLLLAGSHLAAAPPWAKLFKRVESDPNKAYRLQEEHGPWLILAANFVGPEAHQDAHELILELRKRYKLQAYMHTKQFDFTERMPGITVDKFGRRKTMRYFNNAQYEGVAVLIGDFVSVDDADLSRTLEEVKNAEPECLRKTPRSTVTGLRELYRMINSDRSKRAKGPMGSAFVTRNPLLPASFFAPGGVDEFVVRLNRGVQHSLLENPGSYSVRVATFRGASQRELETSESTTDKLEKAADKAHRLTMALRRRGVEAYEFHDRHESIVTVGSFQSEGAPLPNGAVEINPAILRIMQEFKARPRPLPGGQMMGMQPLTVEGVACDVQPKPIRVPRGNAVNTSQRPGLSRSRR